MISGYLNSLNDWNCSKLPFLFSLDERIEVRVKQFKTFKWSKTKIRQRT
jgi:hypothetical protein